MTITVRKATTVAWLQDPGSVSVRKATTVAWVADRGVTLRNIDGYAFESPLPQATLRQVVGYAFESAGALNLAVTGDLALYALINSDSIASAAWSATNSTLGVPYADASVSGTNTIVNLASISGKSGYQGNVNLHYNRQPLSKAISTSVSLGTIASDTTIYNLLPTINSKYAINLTQQDLVDGPVAAGSTFIQLTVAPGSWLFLPGSVATAGVILNLAASTPNVNLPGFLSARGNLVDPSLASVTPITNLPGFDDASGNGPAQKTVLLMHFDGANGSTSIQDEKAHVATVTGAAALSTAVKKFGTAALKVATAQGQTPPPSVSVVDAPDLHLTGDFTIDVQMYLTGQMDGVLLSKTLGNNNYLAWTGDANGSGTFRVLATAPNGSQTYAFWSATMTVPLNTWVHLAVVRQGSTWRMFVGGNEISYASQTAAVSLFDMNAPLIVGSWQSYPMVGYLDELRISNVARYTANFTPPVAPFTVD